MEMATVLFFSPEMFHKKIDLAGSHLKYFHLGVHSILALINKAHWELLWWFLSSRAATFFAENKKHRPAMKENDKTANIYPNFIRVQVEDKNEIEIEEVRKCSSSELMGRFTSQTKDSIFNPHRIIIAFALLLE